MQTTITEALAELKTIAKRVEKKKQFILQHLGRSEGLKDPLERDGGMVARVQEERQSTKDLQERTVAIRRAVQRANDGNTITVDGESRSIADWLVWRREVAPAQKQTLQDIRTSVNNMRIQAKKQDGKVLSAGEPGASFQDVIVSINENDLAKEIEHMELVLGVLDGQLSLKNATITIDV